MLRIALSARRGGSLLRPAGRGCPAATHFSLLRQRKVSKRKATLVPASPALRSGATCGARPSRGLAKLAFGSDNASPDPSGPALLVASTRGNRERGPKTKNQYKYRQGLAMASPCFFRYSVLVFGCLVFMPHPLLDARRNGGSGGSGIALC